MKRRDFLKASVLGCAGIVTGQNLLAQEMSAGVILPDVVTSDGKPGNVSNGVEDHLKVSGYVKEPAHKVPVVAEADVVVVGGGAAGVSAAVCAARQGASVILIEKANFLGGLWTGGLVLPVLATHAKGKYSPWERATNGYCLEICNELIENGWAIRPEDPIVDPEATKYVLEKSVQDAGVRMLYNATAAGVVMSGNRIDAVLVDCNTGRIAIKCKAAVDTSGDGCLFNWAGDPHEDRRYHMSVSYRVGNATEKKFGHLTPIPNVTFKAYGTKQVVDGLDIFEVSARQQQGRLDLWEKIEKLKEETGNKEAYLMELGPITGVRVTRVLESLHNVTLEESMQWTEYPDKIGMSGVDCPFLYKGNKIARKDRPIWQIPYRSLIPKETRNLLVAGRCFGYDQGITWDAREIATCMVTGQAAGTAAALSVFDRCAAKDLDITRLQATLRNDGVRLDF